MTEGPLAVNEGFQCHELCCTNRGAGLAMQYRFEAVERFVEGNVTGHEGLGPVVCLSMRAFIHWSVCLSRSARLPVYNNSVDGRASQESQKNGRQLKPVWPRPSGAKAIPPRCIPKASTAGGPRPSQAVRGQAQHSRRTPGVPPGSGCAYVECCNPRHQRGAVGECLPGAHPARYF